MGNIYTVTQVNSYIKHMFSEDFLLKNVSVSGEISNLKYHSSGHIYFSLKESNSVIACVMFKGNRAGLKFEMKEGQKVIVKGSVEVYERDGKYQLYAREIFLDGEGDLFKRFEQLKKELLEMGMFDNSFKKPIPKYATKIGIVTASTGAAIQDIINISTRRNPHVELFLYSAIVQGEDAKYSIVDGIETLDGMGLDVLIVGRGGGSIEDLWAFNEEMVARAIFNCDTPVISAVGHETDTTIADYVADMRAPTPSAAAELAVFDYNAFLMDLEAVNDSLKKSLLYKYNEKYQTVMRLSAELKSKSPLNQVKQRKELVSKLKDRLDNVINRKTCDIRNHISVLAARLDGLSPVKKLSNGCGYISSGGKLIKDVNDIKVSEEIQIDIINGKINAVVNSIESIERKTN